jgi:hypothetical protein
MTEHFSIPSREAAERFSEASIAAQKESHESYHPIRWVAELKNLDWTDLTPEERNRLSNVRNVPDVVIQALQDRWKELHNAVVNLEAEMDQISDFVEGFWRNLEGGGEDG